MFMHVVTDSAGYGVVVMVLVIFPFAAQVHQQRGVPIHQNQQTGQGRRGEGTAGGTVRAGQLLRSAQGRGYQQGGEVSPHSPCFKEPKPIDKHPCKINNNVGQLI